MSAENHTNVSAENHTNVSAENHTNVSAENHTNVSVVPQKSIAPSDEISLKSISCYISGVIVLPVFCMFSVDGIFP